MAPAARGYAARGCAAWAMLHGAMPHGAVPHGPSCVGHISAIFVCVGALAQATACRGDRRVALGPCDDVTLRPDLDWLQRELEGPDPPKMVRARV